MSQIYSNPKRESDTYSLPDVETFYMAAEDFVRAEYGTWMAERTMELEPNPYNNLTDCSPLEGWYYWPCFPGCLPDSDPMGPYATEAEAVAAAQEDASEYEDEDAD